MLTRALYMKLPDVRPDARHDAAVNATEAFEIVKYAVPDWRK